MKKKDINECRTYRWSIHKSENRLYIASESLLPKRYSNRNCESFKNPENLPKNMPNMNIFILKPFLTI